jgi:hypothetical protein
LGPQATLAPQGVWCLGTDSGGSGAERALIDLVYDQFANGRHFRVLNIVDDITGAIAGLIPGKRDKCVSR